VQFALKADLLGAYAVRASAEVGLLEALRARPRSTEELVGDGFHGDALAAVLPYLRSVGIVTEKDGGWQLTHTAARFLTPLMLRALSLSGTGTRIDHAGQALGTTLRNGGIPYVATYGADFWSDLSTRPAEQQAFHEHLERVTSMVGRELAPLMAPRRFRSVADLGGGRGALAAALSEALPDAVIIVFEHPAMIQVARRGPWLNRSDGVRLQPGDLFSDELPSADVYLLCQVLHDWDDERAVAVLSNVHAAMRSGGHLWVVERTLTRDDPAVFAASSLRMYALFGARERGNEEYVALARSAGLDLTSTVALSCGFQVFEFGRA
jgi:hypothetical protein